MAKEVCPTCKSIYEPKRCWACKDYAHAGPCEDRERYYAGKNLTRHSLLEEAPPTPSGEIEEPEENWSDPLPETTTVQKFANEMRNYDFEPSLDLDKDQIRRRAGVEAKPSPEEYEPIEACSHQRLDEDGMCRRCGADVRKGRA